MAIIIGDETRVVVQGMTGNQGSFHTGQMVQYGTKVVAGTSPTKAGQDHDGIPVFASVREAVLERGANASIVFVPASFAKDAAFEAIDAGCKVVVMIPEHIPVQDSILIVEYAHYRGAKVVGPNTYGVISPGKCKMGIMPNHIYKPGPVGLVARSGTLSYEIAAALTDAGLGQSTAIGMGGDPVVGQVFNEVLHAFEQDPETKACVLVGEIGGSAEEEAAEFIKTMTKPVVAYLLAARRPRASAWGTRARSSSAAAAPWRPSARPSRRPA